MKSVYSTGEIAKICNTSITQVIRWFKSGELVGFIVPGSQHRRIMKEALIRFLLRRGMAKALASLHVGYCVFLISDKRPITQHVRKSVRGSSYQFFRIPDYFALGELVYENFGALCWVVIDTTTPLKVDLPWVVASLVEHEWNVVLLTNRGRRIPKGLKDVFYFPFDPPLLSERLKTLLTA